MSDEQTTFECAYTELENVVSRLQDGGLSLEESMALFEQGMRLAKQCSDQLEQAELRIRQLLADGNLQSLAPEL